MLPATAWDDQDWGRQARGWTVMGRLRDRQDGLRREAREARKRERERLGQMRLMTPASRERAYEDTLRARWTEGPTVVAFLFAQPDSDAIRTLDARGDYFDVRTGDTWDLFFPGYYIAPDTERKLGPGDRPVGSGFGRRWLFNPRDFDLLRRHVEKSSEFRWRYSGGTDLVLVNAWLSAASEPTLDWVSTQSGALPGAPNTGSLGQVVEAISQDLESGAEDASYGVRAIVHQGSNADDSDAKKVMLGALSGIAAALAKEKLGI